MALVIGDLAKAIVNHSAARQNVVLNPSSQAQDALRIASDHFKKVAARDALYLTLIGEQAL